MHIHMDSNSKQYPENHWLRSDDSEKALDAYLDQQNKAYSRVKNDFVIELLGDLREKRFLDYGCGAGLFTVHAARQGALEAVGVDALDTALATARHFATREGVDRQCSFVRSREFPKLSRGPRFDVILMKDVIEHVPDDGALLHAASEIIVPGGRIVLSTQNSLSLNYLIQGMYHHHVRGDKQWCGWDETHLRFYTPMSLRKKLGEAGFDCDGWRSVYLIPYKLPAPSGVRKQYVRLDALSWIDRALGGVFPYNRLGWNVIVRARASRAVSQRLPLAQPLQAVVSGAPLLVTRESVRVK